MTAPKDINPADFALFLGTTLEDAKAILNQERQELAATGDPDIHDGYNYRTQRFINPNRVSVSDGPSFVTGVDR